ncbi:MAG: hypothetical protein IT406_03215 [Candidatus Yanofskybacteria bacterium]|nr:hypothetical protein [Candidatus Yanofskybacteria bacterium]
MEHIGIIAIVAAAFLMVLAFRKDDPIRRLRRLGRQLHIGPEHLRPDTPAEELLDAVRQGIHEEMHALSFDAHALAMCANQKALDVVEYYRPKLVAGTATLETLDDFDGKLRETLTPLLVLDDDLSNDYAELEYRLACLIWAVKECGRIAPMIGGSAEPRSVA